MALFEEPSKLPPPSWYDTAEEVYTGRVNSNQTLKGYSSDGIPIMIDPDNTDVWRCDDDVEKRSRFYTTHLPRHLWNLPREAVESLLLRALQHWNQNKVDIQADKVPEEPSTALLKIGQTRYELFRLFVHELFQWFETARMQMRKCFALEKAPSRKNTVDLGELMRLILNFDNKILTFPSALPSQEEAQMVFTEQEAQMVRKNIKSFIPAPDSQEETVREIYQWESLDTDDLESKGRLYGVCYEDQQTGKQIQETLLLMPKNCAIKLANVNVANAQISIRTLGENLHPIPITFIEGRWFYRLPRRFKMKQLTAFREEMDLFRMAKGEEWKDQMPFGFIEVSAGMFEGPGLERDQYMHRFIWLGKELQNKKRMEAKLAQIKNLPQFRPTDALEQIKLVHFPEGYAISFPAYFSKAYITSFKNTL